MAAIIASADRDFPEITATSTLTNAYAVRVKITLRVSMVLTRSSVSVQLVIPGKHATWM